MKYAKLEQMARAMSAEEAADTLKELCNDSRFPAVVKLILDQKELAGDSSCQLKFANCHGALAHAAGVRYGMLEIEGKIRQAAEPPRKTGQQPPNKG